MNLSNDTKCQASSLRSKAHPIDEWRAKYGGMDVADAKRVRELESEKSTNSTMD